jgi:predicted nuclease of predicted toxin-antitoxin system
MRLITDENISWRLKKIIPQWEILPSNEIKSIRRLTDLMIWRYARENGYTILTFDEDFSEIQNLFSHPPKIIWLRTGNVKTVEIASILIKLKDEIEVFLANDELGVYEVYL